MPSFLRVLNQRLLFRHQWYQFSSLFHTELSDVKALKGVGRDRRCFIMGNGPSLKKIDPAPLRHEVTFGSNGIYLVKHWLGFLPTYHVTEDQLVIEDRGEEIAALKGPTKFYDRRWNQCMPPDNFTIQPRVIYDYSEYRNFPNFSTNAARCLWTGGTVSYLCLQLAYYMEFDPVILIGFDHAYQKPAHVIADGNVWTSHGDDPNHIDPNYFGNGYRWHDPRVDRMELAYRKVNQEFSKRGKRVLNATSGGQLEVFPRVAYDSLF